MVRRLVQRRAQFAPLSYTRAGVRPDAALYANIHPQHWYARPSGLRYYRWRHRLGVHLLPRLRAVRAALASDQTRHQQ